MQMLGAVSLLFCVISMLAVMLLADRMGWRWFRFSSPWRLMALSLGCLIYEVWISGGALRILLNAVEKENCQ